MRLHLKAYVPELNKTVDVMGYHPVNDSVYLSSVHLFGRPGDDVLMYCGEEPDQVKLRVGTGLKDHEGTEIYGGDFILWVDEEGGLQHYAVEWGEEDGTWWADGQWLGELTPVVTVVGNIYENSDLVEVKA